MVCTQEKGANEKGRACIWGSPPTCYGSLGLIAFHVPLEYEPSEL